MKPVTIRIRKGQEDAQGNELGFYGAVVVNMPTTQKRLEISKEFYVKKSPDKTKEETDRENIEISQKLFNLVAERVVSMNLSYDLEDCEEGEEDKIVVTSCDELEAYAEGLTVATYIGECIIGGIVLGKKKKAKSKEA